MPATIRPITPKDIDHVVDLALRAWAPVFQSMAETLGPGLFQHFWGSDWRQHQEQDVRRACSDYATWVADDAGQVVGFTAVDVPEVGVEGEIYMVAVDPAHQRRGIGAALTSFGVEQIRSAGKTVAVVGTGGDPGHAPARATYEKAGFTGFPSVRYYMELATENR